MPTMPWRGGRNGGGARPAERKVGGDGQPTLDIGIGINSGEMIAG